jgi:hypothetical protein
LIRRHGRRALSLKDSGQNDQSDLLLAAAA